MLLNGSEVGVDTEPFEFGSQLRLSVVYRDFWRLLSSLAVGKFEARTAEPAQSFLDVFREVKINRASSHSHVSILLHQSEVVVFWTY